jgi:hypothetical protein
MPITVGVSRNEHAGMYGRGLLFSAQRTQRGAKDAKKAEACDHS